MSTLVISITQMGIVLLGAIVASLLLRRSFKADESMLETLGDPEAKHLAAAGPKPELELAPRV